MGVWANPLRARAGHICLWPQHCTAPIGSALAHCPPTPPPHRFRCPPQVLAVAPSNVAVDNIVERLAVHLPGSSPRVLRIGHPARMTPLVLKHCLDAKIQVRG